MNKKRFTPNFSDNVTDDYDFADAKPYISPQRQIQAAKLTDFNVGFAFLLEQLPPYGDRKTNDDYVAEYNKNHFKLIEKETKGGNKTQRNKKNKKNKKDKKGHYRTIKK
jgi:hypothetical protein